MLKFVKHNLETIVGVEIYPMISLVIFFSVFMGYTIYAFTYKKEKADKMSQLPFQD